MLLKSIVACVQPHFGERVKIKIYIKELGELKLVLSESCLLED